MIRYAQRFLARGELVISVDTKALPQNNIYHLKCFVRSLEA